MENLLIYTFPSKKWGIFYTFPKKSVVVCKSRHQDISFSDRNLCYKEGEISLVY
ncbi:MAG: hypothetical protein IKJ22_00515 [Paludibacteraceae bacterium]|nr:hypothetical protein [Paludibacteraceae bacterium]